LRLRRFCLSLFRWLSRVVREAIAHIETSSFKEILAHMLRAGFDTGWKTTSPTQPAV
jgi:hypothetical protein